MTRVRGLEYTKIAANRPIEFEFDTASRLQTVNDGSGDAATYSYVANSPLVSQIVFAQNGTTRMTTTKQYDFLNRLTEIASTPSAASAVSFGYQYNSANQRIRTTLGDGSYWVYQYDSLGQVVSGKKYWADGTPVAGQQFDYGFDDIGNRKSTKTGGDEHGWNQRLANYSANNLNQITSRDVPGYVDVKGVSFATNTVTVNGATAYRKGEYFWDELGVNNSAAPVWEGVTVAATGQSTVSGNVFVPKTPEAFSYDADGNLLSDGRWNYTWDAENRLVTMVSATTVGPQQLIKFEYDWQGRRIRKQVWDNTSGSGSPVLDERFIYDGWNCIAVLSPQSSVLASFLWGNDLSGSPQGARGVGGLLEVSDYGTQTTNCFVAFDGNGNVVALVNAADGTTVANYEYGPFGEVIRQTGPMAKANPLRFSTKYQDDESDMVYYGYRYYDPSMGRWVSRDPLFADEVATLNTALSDFPLMVGTAQVITPNVYAFTGNSPLDEVDPAGFCGCQTVRYTEKSDLDVPMVIADAEVYFQARTTVRTCAICCSGGGEGATITAINDVRVTGEFSGAYPVIAGVTLEPFVGVSGGGAIVSLANTCTGAHHSSGCWFYKIRAGASACAGFKKLVGAKVCVRAYALYTHRTCANSALDTSCLQGRAMVRVTFLWRTYDYIFWQSGCGHPW